MSDYRPVTRAELDDLAGEALPERAAMSLINANVAIPVNAAVAANVLTDHSTATAKSAAPVRPIPGGEDTWERARRVRPGPVFTALRLVFKSVRGSPKNTR